MKRTEESTKLNLEKCVEKTIAKVELDEDLDSIYVYFDDGTSIVIMAIWDSPLWVGFSETENEKN